MAEVKLSIKEYHNVVKSLNILIEKLYEMTKKCSDYKRQRDELINDMAEVKRKAEAFDEIAVTVLSEDNDVIKNMNNIVTKIVINNLERGSDEQSKN